MTKAHNMDIPLSDHDVKSLNALDAYSKVTDSRVLLEIGAEDGVFSYLATLPEKSIIAKVALSKMFGICGRTVTRMVDRGEIPPPIRVAGKNVWVAGRLLNWLLESARRKEEAVAKLAKRHLG